MKQRLEEIYRLEDVVEIYLRTVFGEDWYPGKVVRMDYPGLWVETQEGGQWFVTNRARIRKAGPDG